MGRQSFKLVQFLLWGFSACSKKNLSCWVFWPLSVCGFLARPKLGLLWVLVTICDNSLVELYLQFLNLEAANVELDSHAILWCSSINGFSISPPINVCQLNPSLPTLLNPNIFPKNSFPRYPWLWKSFHVYESAFRNPQNTFVVNMLSWPELFSH